MKRIAITVAVLLALTGAVVPALIARSVNAEPDIILTITDATTGAANAVGDDPTKVAAGWAIDSAGGLLGDKMEASLVAEGFSALAGKAIPSATIKAVETFGTSQAENLKNARRRGK